MLKPVHGLPSVSLKLHLIFWALYLLFKALHEFSWIYPNFEFLTLYGAMEMALLAQLIVLPPKVAFTYWLLYGVLFVSGGPKFTWMVAIKGILGLVVALFLHRWLAVYVALPWAYTKLPEDIQPFFLPVKLISGFIALGFVSCVAVTIAFYLDREGIKEKGRVLEKEKMMSELKYLKQQTNPHFLFNTLNNLYGLARKQSPETPEALLKLSKLLRFILYDSGRERIPLAEDIEIIEHYIGLEKLRYGSRLQLEMEVVGEMQGKSIAPLLLLPLIENAFKHGASESQNDSRISVLLKIIEGELVFKVSNNIPDKLKEGGGIGLENLRRQLQIQYPGHSLTTEIKNGQFIAILNLNLVEYDSFELSHS